jgi:hypothetical protein
LPLEWGSAAAWTSAGVGIGTLGTYALSRWFAKNDKHVDHASGVSAWYEDGPLTGHGNGIVMDGLVVVANDAKVAAHKVVLHFLIGKGSYIPSLHDDPSGQFWQRWIMRTLPPGKWMFPCNGGWRGMSASAVVEVAFTDSGGKNWVRLGDGTLRGSKTDAFKRYALAEPFGVDAPISYVPQ